jgi:hypothetical protein
MKAHALQQKPCKRLTGRESLLIPNTVFPVQDINGGKCHGMQDF